MPMIPPLGKERQEDSGVQWPDSLAELESSNFRKRLYLQLKRLRAIVENTQCQPLTSIFTHTHTHEHKYTHYTTNAKNESNEVNNSIAGCHMYLLEKSRFFVLTLAFCNLDYFDNKIN